MQKILIFLVGMAFVVGCGGASYKSDGVKYKVKKDKVVETSYGSKKYAKYFYKEPHVKNNKNIYVIGAVDVPGDSSPTRCQTAADLQARVELAGELNTRLENQLQYSAEGMNINTQNLNQIAQQSTKIDNLSGVFIDNRFWEKKIVMNGPDTYIKYTCYSRAVMPLEKFKAKVDSIIKENEAKDKMSAEFQAKVDASWDQFFKPVAVEDEEEYTVDYLENVQ